MNLAEMQRLIRDEVEHWPGVSVDFIVDVGKHPKSVLTFGGTTRKRAFSRGLSDAFFGQHRALADVRRCLREMGATRDSPEPKSAEEKPHRRRNPGAGKRMAMPATKAPVETGIAEKLKAAGVNMPEIVVVPEDGQSAESARAEARREEIAAAVAAISDGIYFGLDPDIYHAVPALGGSALCQLLVSPATFWAGSWLDPNRPELDEEQTLAQLLGKAYHCARLEPERLEERFCRGLSKADFDPDKLLTSDSAVRAVLKELGLTQSIGNESNQDRARRLIDAGYDGAIWSLVQEAWRAELHGRQPIDPKYWEEIKIDMDRLRRVPEVVELLSDGAAEVSVIWTDDRGLRCKGRFDYLSAGHWADFKTYSNTRRRRVEQAIADAVRYERYYVIAAHYRDAAEAVRTMGLPVRGQSSEAERALIDTIRERSDPIECWLIFQEKGGIPNLFARKFRFSGLDVYREHELRAIVGEEPDEATRKMLEESLGQKTGIYRLALMEITKAKTDFITYSQVYEPGEPWAPIEPMGTIDDADFNPRWLEGGI